MEATMAEGRTWTIKGVSDHTREAVSEVAHAVGLTVGEWIDQTLAKAAAETLHPRSPAASREDVAEVVRELLDERLAPLTEKIDQATRATAGNGTPSVAALRARLR